MPTYPSQVRPDLALITVNDLPVGKGKGPHRPGGKDTDPVEVGWLCAERGKDLGSSLHQQPRHPAGDHHGGHPFPVAVEQELLPDEGLCPELQVVEGMTAAASGAGHLRSSSR